MKTAEQMKATWPETTDLPCPCGCHSANLWIEPCLHCTPKGCAGWRWGSLRLNVGSGQRKFGDTWINCDVNPKWEPDVVCDGASMPMFADGSAELIVLHHVLEHAGLGEMDPVIRECHRILAPGGSLIATTPDLDALARAWIAGKITDYIYCVQLYGAYMDNEADRHKWNFTQKTLNQTLTGAASWSRVKAFDWRPISDASIAKDWYIIGSEAIK